MAVGTSLLTIDGSYGEGGGTLVRTALAMSAMTQQPVKVENVRYGTRHPGLDPEDVTIGLVLAEVCAAEAIDLTPGSNAFTFLPTRPPKGFSGKIASTKNEDGRGPNALVLLNAILPVLARSGVYSSVRAEGETFGTSALSYDSFANTTLQALRPIGIYAYPKLISAGFGRESVGEADLDIEPSHFSGIDWTKRGELESVRAVVSTCLLSQAIPDRALSHVRLMAKHSGLDLITEHVDAAGKNPGFFITILARFERGFGCGTAMGARGIKVEALVQAAFDEFLAWMASDCSVDPYLADQILLPCVFADGPAVFRVSRLTQRFLTSVWVVKQFVPIHITVRGSENHAGLVSIRS